MYLVHKWTYLITSVILQNGYSLTDRAVLKNHFAWALRLAVILYKIYTYIAASWSIFF